jgi:serine/threonine protein kinase
VLEDERGEKYIVPQWALSNLFGAHSPPIKCVILNACFSLSQGELASLNVPFTIAMERAISDEAAIEFSRGFYDAIGAGRDIEFAYEEGCRTVQLAAPNTPFVSKILKNPDQQSTQNLDVKYKPQFNSGFLGFGDKLTNGQVFLNDFVIIAFKGRGGFSDVYVAWDISPNQNKEVILKLFRIDDNWAPIKFYAHRELELAKNPDLRQIPGLVKYYRTLPIINGYCVVQESIPGRSLQDILWTQDVMSPKNAIKLSLKICTTLHRLHLNNIVHCDVKPLNIIVSPKFEPTVIDLGCARYLHETVEDREIFITPAYAPPELASGMPVDGKADVYSLSVSLLQMMVGNSIFGNSNAMRPYDASFDTLWWVLRPTEVDFDKHLQKLAPPLRAILKSALMPNATDRISLSRFELKLQEYIGKIKA